MLARLSTAALTWWRQVRAAGLTPTALSLREVLRPAPVAAVAAPAAPVSVSVAYEHQYVAALRARSYAKETLRQHVVARNLFTGFEKHSGAVLDPATYDLARHDELLDYLRDVRDLAPNSIYTAVKDLKSFLRFLRDERGVGVQVDLRKLVAKATDSPKLYLSAEDLARVEAALLPANLVLVRDVFLFCCYTGLRYSDVRALHAGNVQPWRGAGFCGSCRRRPVPE